MAVLDFFLCQRFDSLNFLVFFRSSKQFLLGFKTVEDEDNSTAIAARAEISIIDQALSNQARSDLIPRPIPLVKELGGMILRIREILDLSLTQESMRISGTMSLEFLAKGSV